MNTGSRVGRVRFGGSHAAAAWLGLTMIVIGVVAMAQQEPPRGDAVPLVDETPGTVGPSLLTMSAEKAAQLSPMLQEMREILITEGLEVAPLEEAFARATDSREAFRIQRQISAIKNRTEIALLVVRATDCRARGLEDEAERMEQSITYLEDPRANSSLSAPAPRSVDGKAIRP